MWLSGWQTQIRIYGLLNQCISVHVSAWCTSPFSAGHCRQLFQEIKHLLILCLNKFASHLGSVKHRQLLQPLTELSVGKSFERRCLQSAQKKTTRWNLPGVHFVGVLSQSLTHLLLGDVLSMNGNKDAQMDITWPGMPAPKKLKSMCTCVSDSVCSKSQLGLGNQPWSPGPFNQCCNLTGSLGTKCSS